jgi:hypothetical protein
MAGPGDQNGESPDLIAAESTEAKSGLSDLQEIPAGQITPHGSEDGTSQPVVPRATEAVLLHFQREPSNCEIKFGQLVAKRERKGRDEVARQRHMATLARLRECLKEDHVDDLKSLIISLFVRRYRRLRIPSPTDLLDLAWHFYPPRGELNVQVYDIFPDHAEWSEIKLGDVETCLCRRISLFV